MALPEAPISRIEHYLSNIAGEDTPLPERPLSRIEQYLAEIAENGGRAKAVIGWNGQGTPDVTKIPAGVTVTYSGTTYTGTLAPSAETAKYIILVYNGGTAPNTFDEYHTVKDGDNYVFEAYGQKIELAQATQAEINARTGDGVITPQNLDYAVGAFLRNGSAVMTDAEKAHAQGILGSQEFVFTMADDTTVTKSFVCTDVQQN